MRLSENKIIQGGMINLPHMSPMCALKEAAPASICPFMEGMITFSMHEYSLPM